MHDRSASLPTDLPRSVPKSLENVSHSCAPDQANIQKIDVFVVVSGNLNVKEQPPESLGLTLSAQSGLKSESAPVSTNLTRITVPSGPINKND